MRGLADLSSLPAGLMFDGVVASATPHPTSLRSATFSRKGRREKLKPPAAAGGDDFDVVVQQIDQFVEGDRF
jgi:hypothetical protein